MICSDRESGTKITAHSCIGKCDKFPRASVETNRIRGKAVPQIHGRRLPAGNFVGVGGELVHMERVLYSGTYVVSTTFRVVLVDTSSGLAKAPPNDAVKSPRVGRRCRCGRVPFVHLMHRLAQTGL